MLSIHSSPIGPMGTRDTGGMSVCVLEQARYLGQSGHQVDIFTFDRGEPDILSTNVRLIHLADNYPDPIPDKTELPTILPAIGQALDDYCKSQDALYDIIHSHYWISAMVGVMAQAHWQCPHVTTFHTLAKVKNYLASENRPEALTLEPDLRLRHEQWLTGHVDQIIVPTLREKENLIRWYDAPTSNIRIIPLGVDLELFKPGDRIRARRALNLPLTAPIVLFVGRFADLKNLDHLIHAMASLRRHHPELQLILVGGDGPQSKETRILTDLTQKLELHGLVHFKGRVDHEALPLYYQAANILAQPSEYESFGLVVLESLACGTPVAASDVGIVGSIVQDNVNGVIMASTQASDVIQALERWLKKKPVGSMPSSDTIQASVSSYGWHHLSHQLLDAYEEVVQSFDVTTFKNRPLSKHNRNDILN